MTIRLVASMAAGLLCVTAPVTEAESGSKGCSTQQLRISAMQWTGARVSGSWFLNIDTSGAAVLSTGDKKHPFQLSDDVCAELAGLVVRERFFDLKSAYGAEVIEGGMRELRISLGTKAHSVTLFDGAVKDPDRDAVKRALRVWVAVRALFDVADAEDSRKEDRAFLEQ